MNNHQDKSKINVKPEIQLLMDIQKLDVEIQKLNGQIQSIPAKHAMIDATIKHAEHRHENQKDRLEEARKERRRAETDLRAADQRKAKYLSQQYQVKSNEEMKALEHEIEFASNEVDAIENSILSLLEEEESLKRTIQQEEENLRATIERAEKEQQEVNNTLNVLKAQLNDLTLRKDTLLAQVPQEVREYYDGFQHRYVGDMVVPVVASSCGGCFMQLAPQILVQVHLGKEIVFCDRCHRILAYDSAYNQTGGSSDKDPSTTE